MLNRFPTGAPAVELVGVSKNFGQTAALRDVDLRIEPGEVIAVLGPNGAGKTTAISLMLGLRRPSSGQVRIFGHAPTEQQVRARRGAMLQDSGLPGALTVRELVQLFSTYYHSPLPLADVLGLARLEAEVARPAAKLSGGQRQRLYFALAICGDPDALFLDEPTVAMDVAARRAFIEAIRSFAAAGRTIILTTHDLEEADLLAKRVVVIDRGRIVADGTPASIKARVPGRRVSFRTRPSLDPAVLDGLPISGLEIADAAVGEPAPATPREGGQLVRFLSSRPEEVLRALLVRDVEISELEVTGAGLEEAFLAITGPKEAIQ